MFTEPSIDEDDVVSFIWAIKEDESKAKLLQSILYLLLEQRNAELTAILTNAREDGAEAFLSPLLNNYLMTKQHYLL